MKFLFRISLIALAFSSLVRALDYQVIPVDTGSFLGQATLRLVTFQESEHRLRVINNADMAKPQQPDLGAAVRSIDGIAGVNGGFFAREGYPLGLVIANGVKAGVFGKKSSLVSGLYLFSDGGPQLLRSSVFEKHEKKLVGVTDALQTGPFLIENSKVVKGLSSKRKRNRSFVMEDGKGNWAIGTCESVSLAQLARILSNPYLIRGFTTKTALNLDGGSSSALFWRGAWKMRNRKPVKNYLILVEK